jgi:hypothetical protein
VASTRETQLEQRVAQLEDVVAQLIRSTSAAVSCLGGNAGFGVGAGGWGTWQRTGAAHEDLTGLNDHLQRHPAPGQD